MVVYLDFSRQDHVLGQHYQNPQYYRNLHHESLDSMLTGLKDRCLIQGNFQFVRRIPFIRFQKIFENFKIDRNSLSLEVETEMETIYQFATNLRSSSSSQQYWYSRLALAVLRIRLPALVAASHCWPGLLQAHRYVQAAEKQCTNHGTNHVQTPIQPTNYSAARKFEQKVPNF